MFKKIHYKTEKWNLLKENKMKIMEVENAKTNSSTQQVALTANRAEQKIGLVGWKVDE